MILGSRENLSMRWHHPLYYKYVTLECIHECCLVSLFRHVVILVYILLVSSKNIADLKELREKYVNLKIQLEEAKRREEVVRN
jgi:hypothetical protein